MHPSQWKGLGQFFLLCATFLALIYGNAGLALALGIILLASFPNY